MITERPINRGEVILNARVIGGVQMIDHGEADDKITAVLREGPFWSHVTEVDMIPKILRDRLRHYLRRINVRPGCRKPRDFRHLVANVFQPVMK